MILKVLSFLFIWMLVGTSGAGAQRNFSDMLADFRPDGIRADVMTLPDLINTVLPYAIVGAGLVLFFMLIMGGFTMLTSASDPKKADVGKNQITQALIGFGVVFASYWLMQLVQVLLGVNILK